MLSLQPVEFLQQAPREQLHGVERADEDGDPREDRLQGSLPRIVKVDRGVDRVPAEARLEPREEYCYLSFSLHGSQYAANRPSFKRVKCNQECPLTVPGTPAFFFCPRGLEGAVQRQNRNRPRRGRLLARSLLGPFPLRLHPLANRLRGHLNVVQFAQVSRYPVHRVPLAKYPFEHVGLHVVRVTRVGRHVRVD